ncbi:MAG: hypothetical protein WA908_03460 [Pontixanthobacter sp.]
MTAESNARADITGNVPNGLNRNYLCVRGMTLLNHTDDVAIVACARPVTFEERAALEFALDANVQFVDSSAEQASGEATVVRDRAVVTEREPKPAAPIGQPSLTDLFWARFGSNRSHDDPLFFLAHLLDAGYAPREAAGCVLDGRAGAVAGGTTQTRLIDALDAGRDFAEAVRDDHTVPPSIRTVVAALNREPDQIAALTALVQFDNVRTQAEPDFAARRNTVILAWVLAIAAASSVSVWFGAAATVIAIGLLIRLHAHTRRACNVDGTRAEVLAFLKVAATFDIPPSVAIRASMIRLQTLTPTWGSLPDTREGLISALELPPLSRAMLMKGDLSPAAGRLAALHRVRSAQTITQHVRWNLQMAASVFAAALIGLTIA